MQIFFILYIAVFLLVLNTPLYSQTSPAKLSPQKKAEVVKTIGQLLLDNYVYPDTAKRMNEYLIQRLKHKAYDTITDPIAFANRITNDINSIYHDRHLLVRYYPVPLNTTTTALITNVDENQRIRQANFGLRKVEILNGNIGYIHLERFWADAIEGKKTVKAAMQFVANTNAIIIDLRSNGGGSPETVAMICGFFLAEKTHVNDSYNRAANTITEFWAIPDTTLPQLTKTPLYILTSSLTFSAAEEFAYNLQNLKRATIIGETTGGGAHNTFEQDATNDFMLSIPYGRAINFITKTNWEAVGVEPDIAVAADKALEMAEMKIFENMILSAKSETELYDLNWQLDLLKAINNPIAIDTNSLKKYAGVYGDRVFTYENGKLYYQRVGRPKFELEAISPTIMKGKNNTYFKIEFIEDNNKNFNEIKAYYQDYRIETAVRTD